MIEVFADVKTPHYDYGKTPGTNRGDEGTGPFKGSSSPCWIYDYSGVSTLEIDRAVEAFIRLHGGTLPLRATVDSWICLLSY